MAFPMAFIQGDAEVGGETHAPRGGDPAPRRKGAALGHREAQTARGGEGTAARGAAWGAGDGEGGLGMGIGWGGEGF